MPQATPPQVTPQHVPRRHGIAGYRGPVVIVDPCLDGVPLAPPSGVDARDLTPTDSPADDGLESLSRQQLVQLAVSLGLKGRGKSADLIRAIRGARA